MMVGLVTAYLEKIRFRVISRLQTNQLAGVVDASALSKTRAGTLRRELLRIRYVDSYEFPVEVIVRSWSSLSTLT